MAAGERASKEGKHDDQQHCAENAQEGGRTVRDAERVDSPEKDGAEQGAERPKAAAHVGQAATCLFGVGDDEPEGDEGDTAQQDVNPEPRDGGIAAQALAYGEGQRETHSEEEERIHHVDVGHGVDVARDVIGPA